MEQKQIGEKTEINQRKNGETEELEKCSDMLQ